MSVYLGIHMKRFASPLVMRIIIIITLCAATFSFFFFAPNFFVAKAYAQEDNGNNNSTLILEDMRSILRDQQRDISSISNTSSAQAGALTEMAVSSSKIGIQATYTALSVFFSGHWSGCIWTKFDD